MDQKDQKAVKKFVDARLSVIQDLRNKVTAAGGVPKIMYIGDVFEHEAGKMYISPIQLDTGCRIFGMRVISDFRIPTGEIYITQGAF